MKEGQSYAKHPSGKGESEVIECGMEKKGEMEELDPERAAAILKEETPKRIEQLRRDLQKLKNYLRERAGQEEQPA